MLSFATQFMPRFDYSACKKLFLINQKNVNDPNKFDYILASSLFFSFYSDDKLIGCIYFYPINDKIFFNAFAIRHSHLLLLKCLKFITSSFNCNLYASTDKKHAVFTLRKAGFTKLTDNLYVFYNN